MEQRKLIKLGNSSFAIALPKNWIEKAGLKKGENVFIIPNSNGELIIQPKYKRPNDEKRIEINLSGKSDSELWKEITSAYVRGYNTIEFKNKSDKSSVNVIKSIIDGLLSLEVVENNKDTLVVKDFFSIEEINHENFVRRMDNNIKEMFDIIITSLKKKNISSMQLSDIIEADKDINKFYLLILRTLYMGVDNPSMLTTLKTDAVSLINDWWLSFNLEHIGDELKSIAKTFKKPGIKEKETEEITNSIIKLKDVYADSIEAFYKRDKELAIKTAREGKKLWEECDKMAGSGNPHITKICLKLKEIEVAIYQNTKMIIYVRN